MRRALIAPIVAVLLAAGSPVAVAQDGSRGFEPRTGDAWVDTWLGDINRYGGTYRDAFVDELVRYHGAPRGLVLDLLRRPGWTPGDVYFACSLASVAGRPCRYVAEQRELDRGEGWGALAQRLGIRPGSAEFHRLKRGFVPTYDRWSRPIRLDDDLAREFPGRARADRAPDAHAPASGDIPAPRHEGMRPPATLPAPAGSRGPRPPTDTPPGAAGRGAGKDRRRNGDTGRGDGNGRPDRD